MLRLHSALQNSKMLIEQNVLWIKFDMYFWITYNLYFIKICHSCRVTFVLPCSNCSDMQINAIVRTIENQYIISIIKNFFLPKNSRCVFLKVAFYLGSKCIWIIFEARLKHILQHVWNMLPFIAHWAVTLWITFWISRISFESCLNR